MTYYLLLKDALSSSENDVMYETNILGEESFGVFYPSMGFKIMDLIINKNPEYIEDIKILDEQKNYYSITEFLDIVGKWKIKKT